MTTRRYAENTTVTPDRSRAEIEKTLSRYGATRFLYGWETAPARALIQFEARGRRIRFELPMPDEHADEFIYTSQWRRRSESARRESYDQEVRRRWRALALTIKAMLEAVESGIAVFETVFLPFTVLPDNSTVADWMAPQLDEVYRSGQMPRMLPGASASTIALPLPADGLGES